MLKLRTEKRRSDRERCWPGVGPVSKGIEIYARGATTDSTENVVYIKEVMSVRMWELKDNFTGNRPLRSDTNESKLCMKRRS